MEKQEITVTCKDCGKEFNITVSEQNFYESKGLAFPKRCAECRAARKANSKPEQPKQSIEDMMRAAGMEI